MPLSQISHGLAAGLLAIAFLGACERSAEQAGRQFDRAAGEASQKIDQAGDKAAQKVDEAVATAKQEARIAGRKLGEAGERATESIDDALITAQVKAALVAYPGLKSVDINVTTRDGVVFMTGFVDSPVDRRRTSEIATAVSGVKSVRNHLLVHPAGPGRADAARDKRGPPA